MRIDGSRSQVQRAAAAEAFQNHPNVLVLLGTRVLERGIDGLQHCGVLLSLGPTFNPAREEQRIGRGLELHGQAWMYQRRTLAGTD